MKVSATTKKWVLAGVVVLVVLVLAGWFATDRKIAMISDDIARDHARFTPEESVDIAMAMKIVTHAPPTLESKGAPVPPLLLFPPSAEELERLSGSPHDF